MLCTLGLPVATDCANEAGGTAPPMAHLMQPVPHTESHGASWHRQVIMRYCEHFSVRVLPSGPLESPGTQPQAGWAGGSRAKYI